MWIEIIESSYILNEPLVLILDHKSKTYFNGL